MSNLYITKGRRRYRFYRDEFNPRYVRVDVLSRGWWGLTLYRIGNTLYAIGADPWGDIVGATIPVTPQLRTWLRETAPAKEGAPLC